MLTWLVPNKTGNQLRLVVLLGISFAIVGCKTQGDAATAANQMAATTKTLSDYYGALDQVLAETQEAYDAQTVINQAPPLDLSETRKQIELREQLATEFSTLSATFATITSSTAPTDASTAAGQLNSELVSIKALADNATEQKVLTAAVQLVVSLLQQHDEIKAARQIEPVCNALLKFFNSESRFYDSINKDYLTLASSNAKAMVKGNLVDASSLFLSSLEPFGLTPSIDSDSIKTGMQGYLDKQIDSNFSLKLAAAQNATQALRDSLKEMDARIEVVTKDRVLSIALPPVTLDTVESWVSTITQ